MSNERAKGTNEGATDTGRGAKPKRKGRLATWQVIVLIVAVLVMAGGVAMGVTGAGKTKPAPTATTSRSDASSLARGFAPTGSSGTTKTGGALSEEKGVNWSPVVFRLGFSAFVGFAIGFALRSFLRFSMFALGFFFLMLLGLQYAQIIEIHWGVMGDRYDEATSWISAQTDGFIGFVTGQLPAAGLGVAGLFAGLKR